MFSWQPIAVNEERVLRRWRAAMELKKFKADAYLSYEDLYFLQQRSQRGFFNLIGPITRRLPGAAFFYPLGRFA